MSDQTTVVLALGQYIKELKGQLQASAEQNKLLGQLNSSANESVKILSETCKSQEECILAQYEQGEALRAQLKTANKWKKNFWWGILTAIVCTAWVAFALTQASQPSPTTIIYSSPSSTATPSPVVTPKPVYIMYLVQTTIVNSQALQEANFPVLPETLFVFVNRNGCDLTVIEHGKKIQSGSNVQFGQVYGQTSRNVHLSCKGDTAISSGNINQENAVRYWGLVEYNSHLNTRHMQGFMRNINQFPYNIYPQLTVL